MPNMSYCRFSNTLRDLQDCYEHMDDEDTSEPEKQAKEALIRLAIKIAENYGDTLLD